ncbi:hypothetical protein [Leifsonia sp. SIMBA_070]|uniref:hypothetical protein n=1 Tax=Leifsonia sp. SIMBA_070 TaxID=3085810 RepID=UPI00397A6927
MSDPETERRRALVFFGALSVALIGLAVASLTLSPGAAFPGVRVTAVILLVGAGYGLVASLVALVRRRGAEKGDSAMPESDSAAK